MHSASTNGEKLAVPRNPGGTLCFEPSINVAVFALEFNQSIFHIFYYIKYSPNHYNKRAHPGRSHFREQKKGKDKL